MFELMFCSMLTILPDYLIRRYVQGKRFGKEITLFSVWYELRWGITACALLTVSLITVVFYFVASRPRALVPKGAQNLAESVIDFVQNDIIMQTMATLSDTAGIRLGLGQLGVRGGMSKLQPVNGTVVITGGGTGVSYSPNANYCNTPPGTTPDTFTYTLAPGGGSATVSM